MVFLEIKRVSELGLNEYIKILANWEYITNPALNCNEKRKLYKDPKKLEDFENRNGCGFKITKGVRYKLDDDRVGIHSCCCDHLHDNFNHILFLHGQFEKGMLPFQGSLSDQPAQIIEIFSLIERLKLKEQQKQQRAAQEAAKSSKSKRVVKRG